MREELAGTLRQAHQGEHIYLSGHTHTSHMNKFPSALTQPHILFGRLGNRFGSKPSVNKMIIKD